MNKKSAFILGVSGQDGSYLAKLLIEKGYEVWGSSRDAQGYNLTNLISLGIEKKVNLLSIWPEDFRSVFVALKKAKPSEIYY